MKDKEVDSYLKSVDSQSLQIRMIKSNKDISELKEVNETIGRIKQYEDIRYLVEELKLLRESIIKGDEYDFYSLTKKGRKVLRLGGWLKYLERKDEIEKRNERKENADIKISEFQARNQHLPYIVSFCGVFISIVSLLITCSSNDEPLQKTEHTLEHKSKEIKVETSENLGLDTLLLKNK